MISFNLKTIASGRQPDIITFKLTSEEVPWLTERNSNSTTLKNPLYPLWGSQLLTPPVFQSLCTLHWDVFGPQVLRLNSEVVGAETSPFSPTFF